MEEIAFGTLPSSGYKGELTAEEGCLRILGPLSEEQSARFK